MQASYLLVVSIFLFYSCKKNETPNVDITVIDSTSHTLFVDEDISSIVIDNSGDSTKCYDIRSVDYKIMQLAPEGEWINYVVKQSTATVTCDGQEGQKRTIKIELSPVDNPENVTYNLLHETDEIVLGHDYYQTIFYGCCDAEPVHRIYDYTGAQMLQGNVRVLIGGIPNNALKFFVGYTPSTDDTVVIGTVHLAFDPVHKYDVQILSPPLPPDMCSQYSPDLTLVPTYGRDTLEMVENEYQLWELEDIDTLDQIRNVSIRVAYFCEEYYKVSPVLIPIVKGKPFGKDSTLQRVQLIHLTEPAGF